MCLYLCPHACNNVAYAYLCLQACGLAALRGPQGLAPDTQEYHMALPLPLLTSTPLPSQGAAFPMQPLQEQQQQQQQVPEPAGTLPFSAAAEEAQNMSIGASADADAAGQSVGESSCMFELVLTGPPELELRGWRGAADAPEDLPEDVRSRSLCLLASLGGLFVSTTILTEERRGERQRMLQVRTKGKGGAESALC